MPGEPGIPIGPARPRRRRVLGALVGAGAVLAGLRLVPPFAFVLLPAIVFAGEASPLIAVFALVLAVVAVEGRPRRRALAAVALAAAVVAGVPSVQALAAFRAGERAIAALPLPPRPSTIEYPATSERALPYAAADGSPLTGRLFRPGGVGPHPTVVVVYGGAWRTGNAEQFADLHRRLAVEGYTVVALDYRHAPRYRYPAQLDDVRRGLALVRDSAPAWGVDPARLVLWGRSSGAHLALLAAWTDAGAAPPVRGVVDYYGPADLAAGYRRPPRPDPIDARRVLRDFFGGPPAALPAAYQAASPIAHVRPGLPPTLLVYGGRDHLVEPRFGRALADALRAAGDPAAYVELPWAEHGFDVAPGGLGERVATALALDFIARVTGP